nr:class I SAM-dependent methyltransferase [Carboxylicivirga marina]
MQFVETACGQLASKVVLDMGCGTGALSIAMARRSAKVRAFDYDADMLGKAEEKRPAALDIVFRQGDMRLVDAYFMPTTFDVALCFGNTLVHLQTLEEVEQTIEAVSGRLKQDGRFLLQIVNYDRVIADDVKSLPTLNSEPYTFIRNYIHRSDGKVDFETILNKGKQSIKNSVPLLMIRQEELDNILRKYFTKVEYFGGFDRSQWSPSSFHLVVEATK